MVLGGGGVSDLGRAIVFVKNFKGKVGTQGGGGVKNLIFTMTSYVDGPIGQNTTIIARTKIM
jgi:hypothetical protein